MPLFFWSTGSNLTFVRRLECEHKFSFRVADPLKISWPGAHLSELVFVAFPSDRNLCVVSSIVNYLDRTSAFHGFLTGFFLTTKPPICVASWDILCRWTKGVMRSAGFDLAIFSPHSTRSASAGKAARTLPLATILSTVGWSRASTFSRFYNWPLSTHGCFFSGYSLIALSCGFSFWCFFLLCGFLRDVFGCF